MNNEIPPKLFVRVETWNAETNEMEKVKVINHNNPDSRIWLKTHFHWAFRNGRGIVARPFATYDEANQQ